MNEFDIEFDNEEFLDGYFSATGYFYFPNQRIILDVGYDPELQILDLHNCTDPLYNSYGEYLASDKLLDFYCDYKIQIGNYIQEYLKIKYNYEV